MAASQKEIQYYQIEGAIAYMEGFLLYLEEHLHTITAGNVKERLETLRAVKRAKFGDWAPPERKKKGKETQDRGTGKATQKPRVV